MILRNTRRGWMLAADKGSASGGSTTKTDLEQLTDANARIIALEGEKKAAEQKATDAEARAVKAEGEVKTLEGEKKAAEQKASDAEARAVKAEGEVKTLKGGQKSADERAREIAAASGVTATPKTEEGQNGRTATDGKAIYEAYNKLMEAGESKAASEFWAANEKALDAYAESLTKKSE